jgi:hypothetical protein
VLLRRKVDCLDLPPLQQDLVEEEFRDPGEEHLDPNPIPKSNWRNTSTLTPNS